MLRKCLFVLIQEISPVIGYFYFPHLEWCSPRLNTFIPRRVSCALLPCSALTLLHMASGLKKILQKRKVSNSNCGAHIIVWASELRSDWFILWVTLKHQQTLQRRINTLNYRLYGLGIWVPGGILADHVWKFSPHHLIKEARFGT